MDPGDIRAALELVELQGLALQCFSPKQLRAFIEHHGASTHDCIEKADLVGRARECLKMPKPKAKATQQARPRGALD